MNDVRMAVRRYMSEGAAPVPIPRGEKGPRDRGWPSTAYEVEDFTESHQVGLKTGEPSGGLVDIDLDAPQALMVADALLPDTNRIHGRRGKPRSHRWYKAHGLDTRKYQDIDGQMIVELRTGGCQTLVPPSHHPNGEQLEWHKDGKPESVEPSHLESAVRLVAVAALLARHWPKGSRHGIAQAAAGFLCDRGVDPVAIPHVIQGSGQRCRG